MQTVRLSAGDAGNRVEFGESIDWRTLGANLKAVFPLSAANDNGDVQLGDRHDRAADGAGTAV